MKYILCVEVLRTYSFQFKISFYFQWNMLLESILKYSLMCIKLDGTFRFSKWNLYWIVLALCCWFFIFHFVLKKFLKSKISLLHFSKNVSMSEIYYAIEGETLTCTYILASDSWGPRNHCFPVTFFQIHFSWNDTGF